MTSFPGRGPPASRPPGIDSDKCDMRALAKAGGEFLEGAICAPRIALDYFFPKALIALDPPPPSALIDPSRADDPVLIPDRSPPLVLFLRPRPDT
jgi:hypothetical protein